MLKTPKQGEPITANYLEQIKRTIINLLRPGRGLKIETLGNQILIGLADAPTARPNTGGGDGIWVPYQEGVE